MGGECRAHSFSPSPSTSLGSCTLHRCGCAWGTTRGEGSVAGGVGSRTSSRSRWRSRTRVAGDWGTVKSWTLLLTLCSRGLCDSEKSGSRYVKRLQCVSIGHTAGDGTLSSAVFRRLLKAFCCINVAQAVARLLSLSDARGPLVRGRPRRFIQLSN